jgi:predicted outer membrane repeat protein
MRKIIIMIWLVILLAVAAVYGRDLYVSLDGTNNYPFTNWPDAATNIEWAVNAGVNGDTVWISNGTYVLTNQIIVQSNLTIVGFNGRPVIDGNNSNRCFYISAGNGTLSNLFITGGYSTTNGGGVYIERNAKILYCVFSNNVSITNGGGLYLSYGSVTNDNCVFIANTASNGGGMYFYYPNPANSCLLKDCLFYTNICGYNGGGLNILNANYLK